MSAILEPGSSAKEDRGPSLLVRLAALLVGLLLVAVALRPPGGGREVRRTDEPPPELVAEEPWTDPHTSTLWGVDGELWDRAGPLFDFSFAGYKQGREPLPSPPVTKSVLEFRTMRDGVARNDTEMLHAAVSWANSQPLEAGFIVLLIPAGEYRLEEALRITRSRVVLRGEGTGKTFLFIPKSLYEVYGQNPLQPAPRGYVNNGGFVIIHGKGHEGPELTRVVAPAERGDNVIEVEDASQLSVGQQVDLWYQDVGNQLHNYMYDYLWPAFNKTANKRTVCYSSRITAIQGRRVTLERRLYYPIREGLALATLRGPPPAVYESGVEEMTFRFRWQPYAAHHMEAGYNAVYFLMTVDCWVRNIASINADSTVLVSYSRAATVTGVDISVFPMSRANTFPNELDEPALFDGHWGIQHTHSFDVLAENFDVHCSLVHDVGTGSAGKFGVYMDGRLHKEGNLDLHRALSGPTLYTNIHVGKTMYGLSSGGPPESGPNAASGTTWWGIHSTWPMFPPQSNGTAGSCSFGPAIIMVGVRILRPQVPGMCPTWHYERDALIPPNLYLAMFEKRRGEAPHPPRVFEDVPVYWPIAPVPAPAPAAAGAAAAPAGSR